MEEGVYLIGGNLAERLQDETPEVHSGMRKDEVGGVAHQVVAINQIDVYRTGGVASGGVGSG